MFTSRDRKITRIGGRVVTAVAVTSAVVMASAGTPASAAPSLTCGDVVTRSVTLSSDITDCPGDGLVIGASNVTINLNGHGLTAVGNGGVTGVGNGKGSTTPAATTTS